MSNPHGRPELPGQPQPPYQTQPPYYGPPPGQPPYGGYHHQQPMMYGPPPTSGPTPKNGFGVASLVLGAIAFFVPFARQIAGLAFILAIIAIVLGAVGQSHVKAGTANNSYQCRGGIVLGILAIAGAVILASLA